jgi:hypothetical protein
MERLSATLKKRLGMTVCEVDQAVFFFRKNKDLIVIVAHVDGYFDGQSDEEGER